MAFTGKFACTHHFIFLQLSPWALVLIGWDGGLGDVYERFTLRFPYTSISVVRFPYKCSNMPSKKLFATISADILRICRATSSVVQFIKTFKAFSTTNVEARGRSFRC